MFHYIVPPPVLPICSKWLKYPVEMFHSNTLREILKSSFGKMSIPCVAQILWNSIGDVTIILEAKK